MFVYTPDGMYKKEVANNISGSVNELSATLLLGAHINSSGNVTNYSKGIIHEIQVYDTVLSNWEIAEYMGWTDYILEEEKSQ